MQHSSTNSSPGERSTRQAMLQYQRRQFHELLKHVWRRSAFYREYYGSHGISEKSLDELSIEDLPLLPKKTLIDNFDRAVTDPRLRRKDLEEWFETHRDPSDTFCDDMVVIHGSGTSGDIGIFAYDRKAWARADASLAGHLPLPENYPTGKTRVAFYVAAGGHFATVSMANSMPQSVYDTLILSLLDSTEQTIEQLTAFQPHRLTGYSSSVAQLAELALDGRLEIFPQRIFVVGDRLTESMEGKIRAAWDVPLYVLYAASESKCIAIKTPERGQMTVLDDLNIVEVLDDCDRAVDAEQEGRVVLTNLYNSILPILRYELGDYVVRGTDLPDSPLTTLRDIRGRTNDALPIVLASGQPDSIHPIVVTTFFVPTIEKFQFVSEGPAQVRIDYVAPGNIDTAVRHEFERMLAVKGGGRMTLHVRRVPSIANDPVTGKLRLVRFEGQRAPRPTLTLQPDVPPAPRGAAASFGRIRIQPDPSFVPFTRAEVEQSIPARFERQVEKYFDRLAVKSGDLALSYSELNRAANRVAHAIIARLGTSQEPVALLLQHGVPPAIAMLGILKAGKCCVPLDPSFPASRLVAILEEAGAALLLTDDRDMAAALALTRTPANILNVDALDISLPVGNPGLAIADALAYLFFTSGSTGRPKGVAHTHCHGLHQIMAYSNGLKLGPEDRVTQLHSHGFSASRLDIFGALLNGAALLPMSPLEDGMGGLARRLIEERATLFHWVPTAFRHFADSLAPTHAEGELFPKVRLIVLGSEPLTTRDVELYKRHFSRDCVLVNRFGATETGNITWLFLDKQTSLPGGRVPVGYPVDDTEVRLLDETGKEVGDTQTGEIAVTGAYLPSGYWRRPQSTDDVFSPALGYPGKVTYRTGDMGRRLADGCLVHLGRKDSQVKIRGYRVEPEDVQSSLLDHPAVAAAVVMARPDSLGDVCLVAYYVAAVETPPTHRALRRFLEGRLPTYMVPAAFICLEALPFTPNGKLDREALPEPNRLQPDGEALMAEPRTGSEETLAAIWSSVLGVESVSADDNFLDLGGNSLQAMMIISRAVAAFKCAVSIQEFFELPTIAHMAEVIDGENLKSAADSEMAAMLAMVESLSEEQTLQLLKKETEE